MTPQKKRLIIGLGLLLAIIIIFILSGLISSESIENIASNIPFPIITILIALLDGFNPCTFFVFGLLLSLLISVSDSRKKLLVVGSTFIFVIFVIYFLFLSAWFNIFRLIGLTNIFMIIVGIIAIIAGLINWKEFLWFRKGVTLMIQDKDKPKLTQKMDAMKEKIKNGTFATLFISSIFLALFTSLIEIPCTFGLPIIFSNILAVKTIAGSLGQYAYILLYSIIYILPLTVIIGWFMYFFKEKTISKTQMQWIKLITGLVMVILGLVLIFWPSLII